MKECAFCDHKGKLTAEHIVSTWMIPLFKGKMRATHTSASGNYVQWTSEGIDSKTKVVCEQCNTTWMSDIEKNHSIPALKPMITGSSTVPITRETAHSIAIFAFKTAIVLDHAHRTGGPFFPRVIRARFKKLLMIPRGVQMWLCGFEGHRNNVHIKSVYHRGSLDADNFLELYACTFAFGNVAIQVVAGKSQRPMSFEPISGFESLAIPVWPRFPRGVVWPITENLRSVADFDRFADRWSTIFP